MYEAKNNQKSGFIKDEWQTSYFIGSDWRIFRNEELEEFKSLNEAMDYLIDLQIYVSHLRKIMQILQKTDKFENAEKKYNDTNVVYLAQWDIVKRKFTQYKDVVECSENYSRKII